MELTWVDELQASDMMKIRMEAEEWLRVGDTRE